MRAAYVAQINPGKCQISRWFVKTRQDLLISDRNCEKRQVVVNTMLYRGCYSEDIGLDIFFDMVGAWNRDCWKSFWLIRCVS